VCVTDFRGLGLCTIGIVGYSAGGLCVGGRDSVMTGWGRIGEGCEDGEKSG
jgi:hypothetical protein